MTDDDNTRTIGADLRGQQLTWGHPSLWVLVEDSCFTDCDITITCPTRGIGIKTSTFRGCTVRVKKPLTNFQFFDVTFEGCTFLGKYPGCEFGHREPGAYPPGVKGYVADCDFSRAVLDLVTLNSSNLASLRLPPWPHFTIVSPDAFSEATVFTANPWWRALASLEWPDERAGLVLRYEQGGKRGFDLSDSDALQALEGCRSIRIDQA
jgi:hypothetical protein